MISRAATILAIAVPLGFCLAVSISMLLVCFVRHRRQHRRDWDDISEQQKKLDDFYNLSNPHYMDHGVQDFELQHSYQAAYWGAPLSNYIKKWLPHDKTPLPTIPDEVSRLEAVLFPQVPTSSLGAGRDLRIFNNPQEYTATELATILQIPSRRGVMCRHIMASILLRNTSVKGNPSKSLLPLERLDVDGIYNLLDAIRNGLQLHDRLYAHICRFGFYKGKKTGPEYYERESYHALFETLFQPYFKSNSAEDVAERRTDLNEAFTAAVTHGMNCLGFSGDVHYQWGEKQGPNVEIAPAMLISPLYGGELRTARTLSPSYLM